MTHDHGTLPALAVTSIGTAGVAWVTAIDVYVRIGAGVLSGVASIVLVLYTINKWRSGK